MRNVRNWGLLISVLVFCAACATTYPRQANVDALSDIADAISSADRAGGVADVTDQYSAQLIAIADESLDDAVAAGEQYCVMQSYVLSAKSATYLAGATSSPAIDKWLAGHSAESIKSASGFAEHYADAAAKICETDSTSRDSYNRDCMEARLYRDGARLNTLLDRLERFGNPNDSAEPIDQTCSTAANTGDEQSGYSCISSLTDIITGQFEGAWNGYEYEPDEVEMRRNYVKPLVCNIEARLTEMISWRITEANSSLHDHFTSAAQSAVVEGGVAATILQPLSSDITDPAELRALYRAVGAQCDDWQNAD